MERLFQQRDKGGGSGPLSEPARFEFMDEPRDGAGSRPHGRQAFNHGEKSHDQLSGRIYGTPGSDDSVSKPGDSPWSRTWGFWVRTPEGKFPGPRPI